MIAELNAYPSGWGTYFRHARCQTQLRRLKAWIRCKLRCIRLKQCKRPKARVAFLRRLGVPDWRAWRLALSGKGCWRKARSCQAAPAYLPPLRAGFGRTASAPSPSRRFYR